MITDSWVIDTFLIFNLALLGWTSAVFLLRNRRQHRQSPD